MKRIAKLAAVRLSSFVLLIVGLPATAGVRPLAPATSAVASAAPQNPSALAAQIDALIAKPRYAAADWGVAVVSLESGRTLYAHHADRLFQPASTAKLFTAALTLSTLSADYRIPTRLLSSATVRHGRLDGPLLLYGMGDPTLGTPGANPDWAEQLAAQLGARGIHEIRGDLIADDSYFAGPPIGTGWEASDLQSWFAVPASALSVHENIVALTVTPGDKAGRSPRLSFVPAMAAPPLVDKLVTVAPHETDDINLYRRPGDPVLHSFGSIAAHASPQTFRLSINDPARQAGEELRQALARQGIRLQGQLRVAHWPEHDDMLRANASTLAEVFSPPVSEILAHGLKRSQNLYLQNLLLIDGLNAQAAATGQPNQPNGFLTTEAWGLRALHDLLEHIGIPPSSVLMEEGTGLSRGDLVTPNAMVQLLQYLAAQPYAAQLRDMLPIAGVDGTLKWRMRDTSAMNNVHAKTGSMDYVHSLAGYVTTATGKQLAFVVFLNNDDRSSDEPSANRDIDAIAELLATYSGQD